MYVKVPMLIDFKVLKMKWNLWKLLEPKKSDKLSCQTQNKKRKLKKIIKHLDWPELQFTHILKKYINKWKSTNGRAFCNYFHWTPYNIFKLQFKTEN